MLSEKLIFTLILSFRNKKFIFHGFKLNILLEELKIFNRFRYNAESNFNRNSCESVSTKNYKLLESALKQHNDTVEKKIFSQFLILKLNTFR